MGGCRCTYKNCSSRTDGVIHMFHYPVFDKVRCHQWLMNAQKLEFLNLKVSQLKNRVVCQHHFRDDNFMNFLKDKLTFDAVPTLDGPNCDSSQLPTKTESKVYNIALEDIENEYLTFNDKKANFSVKYADFLTNCDLTDLDLINQNDNNKQMVLLKEESSMERIDNRLYPQINDNNYRNTVTTKPSLLNNTIDMIIEPKNSNVFTLQMSEVPVHIDVPVSQTANVEYNLRPPKQVTEQKSTSVHKNKKITIIEEKNLTDQLSAQLPLPIKLEPICPSDILPLPNKKRKSDLNIGNKYNNAVPVDQIPIETSNNTQRLMYTEEIMDNSKYISMTENLKNVNNVRQVSNENLERIVEEVSIASQDTSNNLIKRHNVKKNNSTIKNKIPPERAAAIEEKRKFNMKLRDIIAECLDKLDQNEDSNYDNNKLQSKLENHITNKVSSYLAKEPELPNIQDYAVAYLEDRINKMETRLINRIHQNTERIVEIKKMVESSRVSKTTTAYTQTHMHNENERKKQLYHELSKYLSTDANSLIYEELFINKHVQKNPKCSPRKRRKYKH